ncbi:MAG TPA: glycine cleavage system protein GcvH [Nitrososphaeraceae archaeon]|nr:glycine cleavage system protein GcvH [Nitrososphaeraceae archaeon]
MEGTKFTKEHEWIIISSEGLAMIGISDFAQEQLGDIVSVELPKVGSKFRQMQPMAIVDSVKASSDIYSPLSGEVVQVNDELSEHPEWINESPYELGWIVKIKPSKLEELDDLMTAGQYSEFIGEMEKVEEKGEAKK